MMKIAIAMEFAEAIKLTIEKRLCPVHDIHAFVDISGEDIIITCCCDYFHARCTMEIENIIYERSLAREMEAMVPT